MTATAVDVLVVGCGPAGASAAYRAAEGGARVLVIDKRAEIGEPVQCAEFVPTPMLPYTRGEGVLAQQVEGMLTFLPSSASHRSAFPGLMIDRGAFDRALAAKAVAAGATLWTAARLLRLDGDTAVLRYQDSQHLIRPRVLIGADGPHSLVGRAVGVPDLEVVYTRQYTVPLRRPYADTDIFLSDAFPGGYGWLFPKREVANLGIGADRRFEDNLKVPLENLHRQMVERGLVGEEILGRTGGAIPVSGLRRMVHGTTLLVGDAAGLTHPITGAGIPAAVISGERAGRAAAAYLKFGDEAEFADFEEDMQDQFETTLARAVARRKALEQVWRRPAAHDDRVMRTGWIAFEEYFAA